MFEKRVPIITEMPPGESIGEFVLRIAREAGPQGPGFNRLMEEVRAMKKEGKSRKEMERRLKELAIRR